MRQPHPVAPLHDRVESLLARLVASTLAPDQPTHSILYHENVLLPKRAKIHEIGGLSKYERGSIIALFIDLTQSSEGLVVNTTLAFTKWNILLILKIDSTDM